MYFLGSVLLFHILHKKEVSSIETVKIRDSEI